jgi:outer membrane receptor protein involved in Fe transport
MRSGAASVNAAAVALLVLVPRPSWPQEQQAEKKPEPQTVKREEAVVVTASRNETSLVDAPATMSVATAEQIAGSPAAGYAGVLRTMAGLNVIETAPGDMYVTSRLATGVASRTQLILVDGRPFSLDFVGTTLWGFAPLDLDDAKKIEVVQGPASAVWGANALTGVVNILSWSPREDLGTRLRLGGGLFGRDAGQSAGCGAGTTWSLGVNHARSISTKWALRVNAGYLHSDAWPRPSGQVPEGPHPLDPDNDTGGAAYPRFHSRGTQQPRVSVRVDQELETGARLIYEAGVNKANGLGHSPIGPFTGPGSRFSFLQARYEAQGLRFRAFGNFLNGENSRNLLSLDERGEPVRLDFRTQTFDLDGAKTWSLAGRHLVSLGADYRRYEFDAISTAPAAQDRNELGGYAHADLRFRRLHVDAAVRLDNFSSVEGLIFSPRLAVLFKPTASQSVRTSFGRSFLAPTALNNYFDLSVRSLSLRLDEFDPQFGDRLFPIVVHVRGNRDVKEESLTMWEIGYTGLFGRTSASVAAYLGDRHDPIANVPVQFYSPANPPPDWPLPSFSRMLPSVVMTMNRGPVRNRGFELTLSHRFSREVTASGTYSWQDDPEPLESDSGPGTYPAGELNVAPHHRFNLGLSLDRGRFLGSLALAYTSGAFWADVLGPSFWGPTPAHTLLGASAGLRMARNRFTLLLKGTNLLDQTVQHHIFGDIMKRSVMLQAKVRL